MNQHITINVAGDLIAGQLPSNSSLPILVVEGLETAEQIKSKLQASIISNHIRINPKHKAPYEVKAEPSRIRVLADSSYLPADSDRTDHVVVLDQATGLMWSVESLGDPADESDGITQEHCIERCKNLRLLGHDDWRLPNRAELAGLIDDTRHEPAIDTALFPRVKPRRHWTSTPAAWSSSAAWFVNFLSGFVLSGLRSSGGFALAVRRAGQ